MEKRTTRETIVTAVIMLLVGASLAVSVLGYVQSRDAVRAALVTQNAVKTNEGNIREVVQFLNNAIEGAKQINGNATEGQPEEQGKALGQ